MHFNPKWAGKSFFFRGVPRAHLCNGPKPPKYLHLRARERSYAARAIARQNALIRAVIRMFM
jgi:hypothetical protein